MWKLCGRGGEGERGEGSTPLLVTKRFWQMSLFWYFFCICIFIALALLPTRKGMMRPRLPECSFLLSHRTGCNDDHDNHVDGDDDDDHHHHHAVGEKKST